MSPLSADDVKKIVVNAIGSSVAIENYSLEPFSADKHGTLGSHSLLKVFVKNVNDDIDCEENIFTFFVKSRPESDVIQNIMGDITFEEEINFYKNIKPLMLVDHVSERWSPRCYLAGHDALVFEDLRAQGYSMNPGMTLDEKLLKSALASLAQFHASSLVAESKLGKPLNKAFPKFLSEKMFTDGTKFGESTILGFKTIIVLAEKLDLDASFVSPQMYDYVYKAVRPQEGQLNVVCHNDLWNNNMLFKKNAVPECVIVDYQVLRYASPVADLSMLLYLNTTPEFRKKLEYEMVQHYYSVFQETVNQSNLQIKIPSYECMLETYKKSRLIGMIMAAMYFPALLIDPEDLQKLFNDPKAIERYMLRERMEVIGPYLDTNPIYAKKIKDLLSEVLDEGKRVLNV